MEYQLNIKFKDEEKQQLNEILGAGDIIGCIQEFDQYLRNIVKYTEKETWPAADELREELRRLIREWDISL